MKLIDGNAGYTYKVLEIQLDEGISRRLQMLGMTIYSNIEVMNKKRNGAMVIKIRGTRYALGKEFVKGIEIGGVGDE